MNKLTNIFKILSDESRLRMIILLYQEELCVCQLCGILDIPQPRISQILSKLRDLNLVKDERKEKFIFYTLDRENIIFISILEYIFSELVFFPQLIKDRNKLSEKQKYLTQCNSK